ncbi:serine hydrolase domain-containing protein [Pseudooceanicola spongiae]|uniref:Serine hydrolase n=1 Tax=Pseudooceanicola spongiae TaxID=2613965 RepID=A0A7L9WKT9_9RHOB|nr:serine hydrolase domain-containing protein [Pseudooceanicola spongiae]QOL80006.1 serine hydrolase [Pseudooceanicola spongiae]
MHPQGTSATRRTRLRNALAVALLLLGVAPPVLSQSHDIAPYLSDIRATYDLPALAAAVVQDGTVIAAAAVGTRVYGGTTPVTLQDRFHLGSNAKSMTATLAGMMVEEGQLRWTSTVGEVLGDDIPGMSDTLSAATLEQLLSHSSGIPTDDEPMLEIYFNDNAFDENPKDLRLRGIDAWKDHELKVPEGSPFQYSNFGYMIVGAMIEKVSGQPWETLIFDRIFDPLGLKTAGLGPQATFGRIDAAIGHRIGTDGAVVAMLWGPAADMPPILGPAGNVHMSVLDYASWAGWNAGQGRRGPALVTPETLHVIQSVHVQTPVRLNPPPGTPGTGAYGFGWGVVDFDWADTPLLTHNGSNAMNLARLVIDPAQDLAVVVLTNFPGRTADTAVGEVMQHLFQTYSRH